MVARPSKAQKSPGAQQRHLALAFLVLDLARASPRNTKMMAQRIGDPKFNSVRSVLIYIADRAFRVGLQQ